MAFHSVSIARFYEVSELQAAYANVQTDYGKPINRTLPAETSVRLITIILDSIRILHRVEPDIAWTIDGVTITAGGVNAEEIAA